MFTGIVAAMGEVVEVGVGESGTSLWIASTVVADAPSGASVALDGVCLTVSGEREGLRRFDVSPETLQRSTLGDKRAGDRVNLERPLRLGDELGGHIVQGHVDGVGTVTRVSDDAGGRRVWVSVPEPLVRYVVEKGSVTLDGVSLTVTGIDGDTLGVALVPHTLAVTTFGEASDGRRVNVEVDVLAKYVERLAQPLAGRSAVGLESNPSGHP